MATAGAFDKLRNGHVVCLRPRDPSELMAGIRLIGMVGTTVWPEFELHVNAVETPGLFMVRNYKQRFRSDEHEDLVVRLVDGSVWEVDSFI